ncbi:MAG: Smr/MutS family protein [Bacilli bacterium]|nr:Smr/MutS family protein [Bacilli bacterium]
MILKSYPALDVHGETRDTVVYPINTFIKDNVKLKNKHIVIIHGRGQGVLRKKVHEILKKNPYVLEFYLDGMNIGATEVILDISSKFDK